MEKPTPTELLLNPKKNSSASEFNRVSIEAALDRSPTGGNSKPFLWHWIDQTLHVQHDSELAAHYLNRKNHTSWIALGCLLTSAQMAAKAQGLSVQCQISWKDLSAKLIFQKDVNTIPSAEEMDLLLERRTYRGPLAKSQAPNLHHFSEANVRVIMSPADQISKVTRKYLSLADMYMWLQKQATRDFFREIVFSEHDQGKEDRGIRVIDLGIGKMDQLMLRFFSRRTWLPSLMARVPVLNSSFKANTMRTLKNAHLMLVTSEDLSPEGLVKVGQAAMKAWVELERQGYKIQPLSMASITLVDAAQNALPQDTLAFFRSLFTKRGPETLKEQFQLTANERPVWLLRVGRPATK